MVIRQKKIDPKLLDELLKDQDPQTVFQREGLLGELKKALAERVLDAEMDVHLSNDDEKAAGNHPAAVRSITLLTGRSRHTTIATSD